MKEKVYIDIDNTIVNFSKQAVEKFNQITGHNKNYRDLIKFDFSDLFPDLTMEQKQQVYFHNFYDGIEIFPNVKEVLIEISRLTSIVFVTKGTAKSLKEKEKWLKDNLSDKIKWDFYGINLDEKKTKIDMSDGYIIDDQYDNIEESKAKVKILFADRLKPTEWNNYLENVDAYIVDNWLDIAGIIKFFSKHKRDKSLR